MFALCSAIEMKAWRRARNLCDELILCDPLRKNYYDLRYQIDQIIDVIDRRFRPHAIPDRTLSPSSTNSGDKTISRKRTQEMSRNGP
jgi:hypothetical protein